jgi:hypothetical protein
MGLLDTMTRGRRPHYIYRNDGVGRRVGQYEPNETQMKRHTAPASR